METLTIAYATDENYAKLVWCSLKSLLENNANFFTVKAYIISDNLSNSSKDKLSNLISSYNGKIVSIRPRACFFPLFSFLPLWLHYNLNPLCVQY